jgi:hypothetical protein
MSTNAQQELLDFFFEVRLLLQMLLLPRMVLQSYSQFKIDPETSYDADGLQLE